MLGQESRSTSVSENPRFTAKFWDGHTTGDKCPRDNPPELDREIRPPYRKRRRIIKKSLKGFFETHGRDVDLENFPEIDRFDPDYYPTGTLISFSEEILRYEEYGKRVIGGGEMIAFAEHYWGVVARTKNNNPFIIYSYCSHIPGDSSSFGAYVRVVPITKDTLHFQNLLIKATSIKILLEPQGQ